MSTIMFKSDVINFVKEDKSVYGIKTANTIKHYGIELPFSLDTNELKQFIKEVKKLYDSVKVGTWFDVLEVEAKKRTFPITKKAKYQMLSKDGKLTIKSERSITNRPKPNDLCFIDKSLRETILGKKLKEYWIVNDEISPEDSQKRLEEITMAPDVYNFF